LLVLHVGLIDALFSARSSVRWLGCAGEFAAYPTREGYPREKYGEENQPVIYQMFQEQVEAGIKHPARRDNALTPIG